ncbi:MAG: ion transporter, partial [Mariprofundus sp.]
MKDIRTAEDHISLSAPRKLLNGLLFDTRTVGGRITNWGMLALIMVVVVASMLNTVELFRTAWGDYISRFEYYVLWGFFVEYVLRIYSARNRWHYIRSFNGVVDLITVLPLFIVGNSLVLMRLLRLARVIRVAISFPVVRSLFASLKGSLQLLMGVLGTIGLISVMVGNMIYILEPQTFSNAFEGTWWSLVTMSTVGYGDFVPQSGIGKMLAASLIMSGICMFAMVTAVISVKV